MRKKHFDFDADVGLDPPAAPDDAEWPACFEDFDVGVCGSGDFFCGQQCAADCSKATTGGYRDGS